MSPSSGPLAGMTDEALVRRVGGGDTGAFDELYARYSGKAMGYLRRMLGGDQARAQDCLQELFLKVIERGHTCDPERRFAPWFFGVAHNLCCSELRRQETRRRSESAAAAEPAPRPAAVDARLDAERFAARLHRELERLDPARRSAFLLRYGQDLAVADIAAVLGCPAGTVKSRLFYTVRQLADRLAALDPSLDPAPGGAAPPLE